MHPGVDVSSIPLRSYLVDFPDSIIGQEDVWLKNEYGIKYFLNSDGLRSDDFKKHHDGEHLLFAGCSNTFGIGTEYENTWAYQVHQEIAKVKKTSGYYNVGFNAATIIESIFQIFSYISKYNKPDVIFFFMPEVERDDAFFVHPDKYTDPMVIRMYDMLDQFCQASGIKLITSTWIISYPSMWESLKQNKAVYGNFPPKLERSELRNEDKMFDPFIKRFKSFKMLDNKKFIQDVYEYSLDHKNDPNLYVAKDNGRHFGSSIHYAWTKQFLERYFNEKNN
jgi:hypothetical protein